MQFNHRDTEDTEDEQERRQPHLLVRWHSKELSVCSVPLWFISTASTRLSVHISFLGKHGSVFVLRNGAYSALKDISLPLRERLIQ